MQAPPARTRTLVARDHRFREHVAPPSHPERPERLDAIDRALEGFEEGLRPLEPRPATDEEILRAHRREHLETLRDLAGRRAQLDPDTYSAPRSFEVACLAAGTTIDLAGAVATGSARNGIALIRPPGHHAEPERPMGFCLFNQVAMAAHALRAEHGLERIAVVDWDVHHGNGTQTQFWDDRDVLFVSLHQFPFYPGTGALTEVGGGDAEGSTVNLPMPAGCGDVEYEAVFREIVVPVLRAFNPEFVLVSAGFDAHAQDPLGSMLVTQAGFRSLASQLHEFADQHCGGRLALALEGGYDLGALGASVREVAGVLTGLPSGLASASASLETPLARDLVARFRETHGGFWKVLR